MNEAIATVGLLVALIGVLIRHVMEDAKYRQKVDDLAKRVTKIDGINGNH